VASWSFTVIDVNKSKKTVASACYDKQHVCIYLQPFSGYTIANSGKINAFSREGRVTVFDARLRRLPYTWGVGTWTADC